ncbi:MAG: class I SAM-dependent methyltransferase [Candidatus Gracilibacteria bacterium]|nr:class I SAM-dependent methyltransferase [Candidatus Gracilibacteria bacterium]
MNVSFYDKIKTVLLIYKIVYRLPRLKTMINIIVNPLDSTRYYEIPYLLKYINKNNLKFNSILDISSPFILSYILSKKSKVIKTDINEGEKHYICDNENLKFQKEDALKLSFEDSSFDFVYSISVIEHIYLRYIQAIEEMIRVCKNGGYIYLTFPVSTNKKEEWLENSLYSDQFISKSNKVFFQYRFDEIELEKIEKINGLQLIKKDIFWERKNGDFDYLVRLLKKTSTNIYLTILKDALVNLYYGFFLLKKPTNDFMDSKDFGNIHYIFKVYKS